MFNKLKIICFNDIIHVQSKPIPKRMEGMKKRKVLLSLVFLVALLAEGLYAQDDPLGKTISQALDEVQSNTYTAQRQEPQGVAPVFDSSLPWSTQEEYQENAPFIPQPAPQDTIVENLPGEPLRSTQQAPEAPKESVSEPIIETAQPAEAQPSNAADIMIDVLELKDMDIADVLKLISKKTGLNIVAGSDIKGKITIYLKNVNVRDVLRIILESNDMAYLEEGGIIRVMTAKDYEVFYGRKFAERTKTKIIQLKNANAADMTALLIQMKSNIGKIIADEKSNTLVLIDAPDRLVNMEAFIKEVDIPIATRIFELSYAKAEDLSVKVSEALTKNVGSVKFDKRSNKLVVKDTLQKLDEIEKVVKAFDEKNKEVLIEAKIIQIILSDQFKMGVDWEAVVSDFHSVNLLSDFDLIASTSKRGKLSVGTLSSDDYTVLLEALDTVGVTNILSSPRITALDNEEAKILVGSTEPYVTTTTTTPATGAVTTAESVNFIDVGVKLYVTPTIHEDDYITMKIKPEVSSVTRFVTTGNKNTIPVVETSQAETTVMVKNGVTIVIGGLIKDEKIDSVSKIPILGDLPIVGVAFRNKDQLLRKTELVIFLTPQIISGDAYIEKDPLLQLKSKNE